MTDYTAGCGTVYSVSVGLGPFVETQPASGSAAAAIKVLGIDLTGATSVRFNGAEASFKVISGSLIGTTVPADATTGPVRVVTPNGTLTSNVEFSSAAVTPNVPLLVTGSGRVQLRRTPAFNFFLLHFGYFIIITLA